MQMSTHIDASAAAVPADFAEFYADSFDFAWRCALRLGADPAIVEDVVQDSFIVALRRFDDFEADSGVRPTTWLFGILRNVLRNHARAERRRRARIERLRQTPRPGPRVRADAALAGRLVDEFLATLDERKRAVFVLGEIEGMTGPEIATALQLNLNTANSRLRSAREAFARYFVDDAPSLARLGRTRAPARVRRRSLPIVASGAGFELGGVTASGGLLTSLGAKLLAASMVVAASFATLGLAAGPGASTVETRRAPARQQPAPRRAAAIDTPSVDQPIPVLAPTADPEPLIAELVAETPSAATPRQPASRSGAIERLEDARAAMMSGDPAHALELVEGQVLDGALERRRAGLEIGALCRLGRAGEAERRARAWRTRHADDPQVSSFVGVCWAE